MTDKKNRVDVRAGTGGHAELSMHKAGSSLSVELDGAKTTDLIAALLKCSLGGFFVTNDLQAKVSSGRCPTPMNFTRRLFGP